MTNILECNKREKKNQDILAHHDLYRVHMKYCTTAFSGFNPTIAKLELNQPTYQKKNNHDKSTNSNFCGTILQQAWTKHDLQCLRKNGSSEKWHFLWWRALRNNLLSNAIRWWGSEPSGSKLLNSRNFSHHCSNYITDSTLTSVHEVENCSMSLYLLEFTVITHGSSLNS